MAVGVTSTRNKMLQAFASEFLVEDDGDYEHLYRLYLARVEWEQKVEELRDTMGGRCWLCGATRQLNAAHIEYPIRPYGERVRDDPERSDLVLLCQPHHYWLDGETWAQRFLTREMLRSYIVGLLLSEVSR